MLMKLNRFFELAIVLACCLSGLTGLVLQRLPLANPIPITSSQLATFTPNVRSEVLSLITNSLATTQAFPSYTSLINANAPLVAASPLNIAPGLGYMTSLSPLRSKVVQVRKPALINPYPSAPFPYITAADVAAAQALNPAETIPQIQQARIDSRKRNKTATVTAQQQTLPVQSPASSNLQIRPVEEATTSDQRGQISDIIQNALRMVQNSPEFLRSLQIHNPAALGDAMQQVYANSLNEQLMNGLQISLFHGPQSQYTPGNLANHQTVVLHPQDHNYQQIVPATAAGQDLSQFLSAPNHQFMSTNGGY